MTGSDARSEAGTGADGSDPACKDDPVLDAAAMGLRPPLLG
eukprot:CAMPEP_0202881346 /NCGR_PEP_ID=MMETSP1391-20130828/36398_1 /ASSEMBLY_ACC=CAM_ASM_000867 /TAXON_ID=1034604 /ORGANISM="Chlamydomonas leiostraca, Strain SAG 11-49" /LENGTH=40 /DNA_ID= /DNA_START= /DNA_END= /DNA_ORIENTATION=